MPICYIIREPRGPSAGPSALAEAKGVVATPMSVFYATPFAEEEPCRLGRLTVCKSREHVQRACDALRGGGEV